MPSTVARKPARKAISQDLLSCFILLTVWCKNMLFSLLLQVYQGIRLSVEWKRMRGMGSVLYGPPKLRDMLFSRSSHFTITCW